MNTLVCFAVPEEARPFRKRLGTDPAARVLVTGMGRSNTTAALESALASFRPGLVLTCGFAGGLDPALASGDVVFDADPDASLAAKLTAAGARAARFVCVDRVVTRAESKCRLREATGADAAEMESAAVREICRQQRIPSATVRVILDPAGEDLPLDFNALLTPRQKISAPKLALALIQSPGKIPALIRLQKQSAAAAEKLAETLVRLLA